MSLQTVRSIVRPDAIPGSPSGFPRRALFALFAAAIAAAPAAGQTGTIAGRVTEALSGQPVGSATINALRAGGNGNVTVRSTADGKYTVSNLPAGTYTVTVTARIGLAKKHVDGLAVQAGQTATLDIAMAPIAAQLDQVVTTATSGAEPERIQDSPNPISVVTAAQIEERPSLTVTDHLKAVPGLSISAGGLAQANIVSRGFNNAFSTQMLMLQDYRYAGVPSLRVNVPLLFTGTNEDIDRIEVLQGPAAALYGPNSGNGVLHIITKSPFQSAGTSFTLDGGERSLVRGSLRHAGIIAEDKLAYKISAEAFTAKDFEYTDPNQATVYSSTDPRIPPSRRGQAVVNDNDLKRYAGEARLDYKLDENTTLISSAGYSMIGSAREITTTFGAAQAKDWSYLNLQERLHHKNFFAQVFYDKSNSGNSDSLDANGTYYLRTGIPVVDKSSILATQVQQGLQWSRTKFVRRRRVPRHASADPRDDRRPQRERRQHQRVRRLPPDYDDDHAAGGLPRRRSRRRQLANRRIPILAARRIDLQTGFEQQLPRHVQPRVRVADVVLLLPRSVFGADARTGDAGADPRQSAKDWMAVRQQLRRRIQRTVHAIAVRPLWRSVFFGRGVRRQCVRGFRHSVRGVRRREPDSGHHSRATGQRLRRQPGQGGFARGATPDPGAAPNRCERRYRACRPQ